MFFRVTFTRSMVLIRIDDIFTPVYLFYPVFQRYLIQAGSSKIADLWLPGCAGDAILEG